MKISPHIVKLGAQSHADKRPSVSSLNQVPALESQQCRLRVRHGSRLRHVPQAWLNKESALLRLLTPNIRLVRSAAWVAAVTSSTERSPSWIWMTEECHHTPEVPFLKIGATTTTNRKSSKQRAKCFRYSMCFGDRKRHNNNVCQSLRITRTAVAPLASRSASAQFKRTDSPCSSLRSYNWSQSCWSVGGLQAVRPMGTRRWHK